MGAARDAIAYAKRTVEVEINSATDNPLVFPEDETCLSGGNFHGQPISLAMDLLGVALTIVGNISERRTARLLDEKLNNGLPAFLIPSEAKKGLNSGLMTVQYTAAALASENKVLAHPACVDSIPTSANFEDFVSMGVTAAQKATQILKSVEYIVAIELLCAVQAIEFRGSEKLGYKTSTEFQVRKSKIDVVWQKKGEIITIEIEANYSGGLWKQQVLGNLQKCLSVNPTKHIHIVLDKRGLQLLKGHQANCEPFDIIFYSKTFRYLNSSNTIPNLIINLVQDNPMITTLKIKQKICKEMGLCGERNVERNIKYLIEKEHKLKKFGERNPKLLLT